MVATLLQHWVVPTGRTAQTGTALGKEALFLNPSLLELYASLSFLHCLTLLFFVLGDPLKFVM